MLVVDTIGIVISRQALEDKFNKDNPKDYKQVLIYIRK
jgi:hypothetical protein